MKYIILIILSLPLLKFNLGHWLMLAISYCLSLIYNSKEKDDYAKALFDIGITLIVIGLETYSMVSIYGTDELATVICTIIGLCFYEILVFVKVKRKAYSTYTGRKLKKGKWFVSSGVLTGCVLGSSLIRNDRQSLLFFLLSCISAMLLVFAISLFQKYLIYKIVKK